MVGSRDASTWRYFNSQRLNFPMFKKENTNITFPPYLTASLSRLYGVLYDGCECDTTGQPPAVLGRTGELLANAVLE